MDRSTAHSSSTSSKPSGLSRRGFLSAAAGLGVAGTLAACGGSGAGSGAAGGKGGGAKTGTAALYNDNTQWKQGFADCGKRLEELCGWSLTTVSNSLTTSYEQVVQSAIKTTKAPDIFKWWAGYRLQSIVRQGGIQDLTTVWDELETKKWLDPQLRENFTYEEKVYGIPLYESYYVFFYSKPTFDKYGLKVPATWDEFVNNCEVLKGNKVTPLCSAGKSWEPIVMFEEILSKLDPDAYVALTNDEIKYTDPIVREAMELWSGLLTKGYSTAPDFDTANAHAWIKQGKLAMYPTGSWNAQGFTKVKAVPDVDYGAFILPPIKPSGKPSIVTETCVLSTPVKAKQGDAGEKVIANWLEPSVQRIWSDFLQDSSANPSVLSSNPVIKQVQETVKSTQSMLLQRYWEASPAALIEGNVQDLAAFVVNPKSADKVLKSMAERSDKEWATWKAAGQ